MMTPRGRQSDSRCAHFTDEINKDQRDKGTCSELNDADLNPDISGSILLPQLDSKLLEGQAVKNWTFTD